jgi:hypothetical protein
MKRDPSVVGRAKLSAETFAEIINGFIEPITYKTMLFILVALFGTIFLSNYAFSMARNRTIGTSDQHHMMVASGGTPLTNASPIIIQQHPQSPRTPNSPLLALANSPGR